MTESEVRKIAKEEATKETGCGVWFMIAMVIFVSWMVQSSLDKRIITLEKALKELQSTEKHP